VEAAEAATDDRDDLVGTLDEVQTAPRWRPTKDLRAAEEFM